MIKQENIMFRPFIFTAIFIAVSSIQGLEAADESHATFNYDIFEEGDDVGDMQVQIIKNHKVDIKF